MAGPGVVGDALHKAARFYEHHGFMRIPQPSRLVQKFADLEAASPPDRCQI